MEGIEQFQVKEQIVPLQGPLLWHELADHNKTQSRRKQEDTLAKGLSNFLQKKKNRN